MSFSLIEDSFLGRGELHHAFLLEGARHESTQTLFSFLESTLSFEVKGNPDFHHYEHDSFGISDGRTLQHFAIQKALGDRKVFVISFNVITREAQNALLKLFEDPKDHTHFFLITENAEGLLPTLRSRLFIVPMQTEQNTKSAADAKKFMSLSKADRLSFMKDFIESKDKEAINTFLGSLEQFLHGKLRGSKQRDVVAKALTELSTSKQYVFDRSSSLKLLLEHVALTMPKL